MEGGGKRSSQLLLLSILAFGLLMRYPTTDYFHEAGADGSYYVALSQIISGFGRIPWVVNPSSYFGLYPFSEGSAVPVLTSGFGVMSGLPTNLSVIIVTDIVTLIGAVGIFLCVLRTTRSTFGGLIGTLAFLTAPILFLYSDQTITSRFYAACWIPFLMLTFIDHRRWGRLRTTLVAVPLVVLLAATHLSFILIIALFFGVGILILTEHVWRRIRTGRPAARLVRMAGRSYYPLFLSACALLVVATSVAPAAYGSGSSGLGSYEIGVFQGSSPLAAFGNLLVSTAGGAGIIGALLTLFAPKLWNLGSRQFALPVLAAILLVFALLSFRLYVRPLVATVMAIGAGLGFVGIRRIAILERHKRSAHVVFALAATFLVVGVASSALVESRWSNVETFNVTGISYSAFLYARYAPQGDFYCNQYPTDRFLTAYTGRMCSPALPGSDLEMVPFITGSISWSQVRFEPRTALEFITSGTDVSLYDAEGYNPYAAYFQLANTPAASNVALLERYQITGALEYRPVAGEYAIRWTFSSPQPSPFLSSLHESAYLMFQNDEYNLWYV